MWLEKKLHSQWRRCKALCLGPRELIKKSRCFSSSMSTRNQAVNLAFQIAIRQGEKLNPGTCTSAQMPLTLLTWKTQLFWMNKSVKSLSLLCTDGLNQESIDTPFAEPTSDDEELLAIEDGDEALGPMPALSWSRADASYCAHPDQDPRVSVTQDGVQHKPAQ